MSRTSVFHTTSPPEAATTAHIGTGLDELLASGERLTSVPPEPAGNTEHRPTTPGNNVCPVATRPLRSRYARAKEERRKSR